MANVSLADVRDAINLGEADIPDDKLRKMVKRAEVTLELELGREIDSDDCSDAEKEFITLLADYVFALRSKLDRVSRYKTARRT